MRLVDDDLDISVELNLDPTVRAALSVQLQRAAFGQGASLFEWRLAQRLSDALDSDLQPPSASQLSYAMSISKALDISLPSEALKFRGSMSEFLGRYAQQFKQLQQRAEGLHE
ncbi:hypothetical protein [Dyella humicola]|uniref:hypothetical protein n=1 Tax=Dyella humicola TaxID=2992126 RepID=UPI00225A20F6|nr:hypothetical protein [Dyella humicola]